MKIGIINYKAGNAQSVASAVRKVGTDFLMINKADDLSLVDGVILPGVGSAGATMDSLSELDLIEALGTFVNEEKRPYLGICVGLQVLFETSEEDAATCLGWLPGTVKRFDASAVRVPQIGWNTLDKKQPHPIFEGTPDVRYGYFVNSYHAFPSDDSLVIGTTDYGNRSTAIVARDHIWATQFHIEKSGPIGLRMLSNFLEAVKSC